VAQQRSSVSISHTVPEGVGEEQTGEGACLRKAYLEDDAVIVRSVKVATPSAPVMARLPDSNAYDWRDHKRDARAITNAMHKRDARAMSTRRVMSAECGAPFRQHQRSPALARGARCGPHPRSPTPRLDWALLALMQTSTVTQHMASVASGELMNLRRDSLARAHSR
jgi:hypothetical protein